jgi:hypothetical protein
MVDIFSLLLPIFLSAVFVFAASSIIHMVLPYHRTDFDKLPGEDAVMDALRKFDLPPGNYAMPYAGSPEAMKSQEYTEKARKGPMALMTVMKSGAPSMGTNLLLWFVYCLGIGIFAAYIAGRALDPGAPYLAVFRFAGAAAFGGYGLALFQNSIWFKHKWSATIKSVLDALIYGFVTGGTFGWLWPSA